jgi:hypothetical protein
LKGGKIEMRRPFLMLGIAVIVALITSVFIYNWLQKKSSVKGVAFETQPLVIAASLIRTSEGAVK